MKLSEESEPSVGSDPTDETIFAERLAAYAELVTARTPPTISMLSELSPELQERLERAGRCLHWLHCRWPDALPLGAQEESESIWRQPEKIGRFQVQREIGRGGMGVVFLAFDPVLQRDIALKIPRPEAILTDSLKQRFLAESKAAASLRHPNVVRVYEAGQIGSVCYIATEYFDGPNLAGWLEGQGGRIAPAIAARLICQLAAAVAHAHHRGIVHRDLKPGNVLMPEDQPEIDGHTAPGTADVRPNQSMWPGMPMLTDFGLAKALETPEVQTRTGALIGTPCYMAPEQAQGSQEEIGPATDVHALGVMFYELMTGRRPFDGESSLATLRNVRTQSPKPPQDWQPSIPNEFEVICLKCLEKEPADRYQTAAELAADLQRALAGQPILAKRSGSIQRFLAWCQRPRRIQDAGILLLTLASTFLAWCGVGIIALATNSFETASVRGTLAYVTGWSVFFYIPMIWLARKTIAKRRYAIRLGWAHISICLFLLSALIWGAFSEVVDPLLGDRGQRRLVDLLVYGSWSVAWLAYLLAFLADLKARRTGIQ